MFEQSKKEKTSLRNALIDDFNEVDKYNNLKNDSLYVGIKDGSFVSPSDVITKELVID